MKEVVVIHKQYIKRLGEQKYFQIQLPRDAVGIIGIEVGAIKYYTEEGLPAEPDPPDPMEEIFRINKTETIGRLSLQIPESADVFFETEVRQQDISSKYADFTQYTAVFDQWSHDRKRHETSVSVKNCSQVIEARFTDSWGRFVEYDVVYRLLIYVWIEKKI